MRILKTFTILCCFLGTLCAQEGYEVQSIEFEGNTAFSASSLAYYMETYSVGALSKLMLGKDVYLFSQEMLDSDVDRLIRFYQREGFLHVQIVAAITSQNHREKKLSLQITVTENMPVEIESVTYNLIADPENYNEANALIDNIWPEMSAMMGQRFRDEDVRSAQEALVKKFQQQGFPYIQITPQITVNEPQNTAEITWDIESGPRCVFSDIFIAGNEHISENLIRKQTAFRSGDLFDIRKIDATQKRIFDLGIFTIVSVSARLDAATNSEVAVEIQVKEAPRLSAKFGVGYGREDRFRAFTETRRLGFLGGARRATLALKHSGLEPYNADLNFIQPAFLHPRLSLRINPFALRQKEPGFLLNRTGSSIAKQYALFDYTTTTISYSFEQVDLDTSSVTSGTASSTDLTALYNKASITFGILRDNSQPLFFPLSGFYTSLVYKYSGVGFRSRYRYQRLQGEVRWYQKISGKWVFASRIKGGVVTSRDTDGFIPVEERFYAGGSNSVRGWSRARLGPQDGSGIPVGGNSLLEIGGELRYPLYGLLSGVVFGDAGNVWEKSWRFETTELRYALGIGIRFETPIGPLRLDAAQPVWDPNKTVQVHVSVGQAF